MVVYACLNCHESKIGKMRSTKYMQEARRHGNLRFQFYYHFLFIVCFGEHCYAYIEYLLSSYQVKEWKRDRHIMISLVGGIQRDILGEINGQRQQKLRTVLKVIRVGIRLG